MKSLQTIIQEKLRLGKNTNVSEYDINDKFKEFSEQCECDINRYNRTSEVEACIITFPENSDILNNIVNNLNELNKNSLKNNIEKCLDYLNDTFKLDDSIIGYFSKITNGHINVFTLEDKTKTTLSKTILNIEFRETQNTISIRLNRHPRVDVEKIAVALFNYLLYKV